MTTERDLGPKAEETISVGQLERKIQSLKFDTNNAFRQGFGSVGLALAKIGIGGFAMADSLNPILHLFSTPQSSEVNFVYLAIGAVVTVAGLRDAGDIYPDFAHARALNTQLTTLRSALNRRYEQLGNLPHD